MRQTSEDPSFCQSCGHTRLLGQWSCPVCGCDVWGPTAPVAESDVVYSRLGGPLGDLVQCGRGKVILLVGARGAGKSSIALLAAGLGEEGAWLVTSEMGVTQVGAYARRLKARVARISTPRWDSDLGVVDLRITDGWVGDVVVDSLNECGDAVAAYRAARAWADRGCRVVCTVQMTQDGLARGGARIPHLCDVVAEVRREGERRELVVTKNREGGGESSTLFEFDAAGQIVRPNWRGWYSIEGRAPAYRAVAHPARDSQWADPLVEAERRGSLHAVGIECDPPAALAARRSVLGGASFVDAEDVDARAAFAARVGLHFHRYGGR